MMLQTLRQPTIPSLKIEIQFSDDDLRIRIADEINPAQVPFDSNYRILLKYLSTLIT